MPHGFQQGLLAPRFEASALCFQGHTCEVVCDHKGHKAEHREPKPCPGHYPSEEGATSAEQDPCLGWNRVQTGLGQSDADRLRPQSHCKAPSYPTQPDPQVTCDDDANA